MIKQGRQHFSSWYEQNPDTFDVPETFDAIFCVREFTGYSASIRMWIEIVCRR